jgi:AAA+ ATPase superfamily predicted ATPase
MMALKMKANGNIIGRENEIEILKNIYKSDVSEFVAIYGRRRVGKTFLIREMLQDKFVFDVSGLANATTREQIVNFTLSFSRKKRRPQTPFIW